ncbi:MAG: Pycsar system effector family protein [Bacteroidota bacterium]
MTNAPATSTTTQNNILLQTQQFVLNLYNQHHNPKLAYHSYAQMNAVVEMLKKIASQTKRSPKTTEVALIATYFRGTGYLENYDFPKESALKFARSFLTQKQYPDHAQVLNSIEHSFTKQVTSVPDALVSDALNAVQYGEAFSDQSAMRRMELEWVKNENYSKKEWQQAELDRLLAIQFYTPYAKINFAPQVSQNIAKIKNWLEKRANSEELENREEGNILEKRPFDKIESETAVRGVQTFFRTNYRNHINLSAIADNKANIMISVNSILISVLITVLTWRNITETQPEVLMPGVIFLITALVSLIFAVLSARPKVTSLNEEQAPSIAKKNIAFFGNFVPLELEEYEEIMDEVLRKEELIYGNMSRDLYFLGKVLSKKYYYLTISYNVFMLGFSISVFLFLFMLFLR